jgi:signal transduction histidine kinase
MDATSAIEGLGLFDIREKLNHLGGRLMIKSTPGQGASLCMQVPLNFCAN